MCLLFDPRIGSNRHEFKTPLFAFLRVQCVNIDPRMFHPFRHREWMRLADWDLSLSEFTSKITQPGVHYSLAKNALAEPNVSTGIPSALSRFSTASRTEKSSSTTQTGGLILFIRFSFAVWLPTTDQGSGIHSSDGSPSTPVSSHFHYAFN